MRGHLRAGLIAGLLAAAACGHGAPDIATLTSNSDQVIWEAGQKALQKKDWESARQHFKRIIDAFPQSQYAPSARIALGDAYVQEGGTASDILSIGAYREFLTLYPSHPRSDYAQFQVAESYFRQKSGPDRDQTQTLHALEEYERLLELYPGLAVHRERARADQGAPAEPRARRIHGRLLLPARTPVLPCRRRPLRRDPQGFRGLRRPRPRPPPHGGMPPCAGTLGGGAPAPRAASSRSFRRAPQADTARTLMEEWSQEGPAPPPPRSRPPKPVPSRRRFPCSRLARPTRKPRSRRRALAAPLAARLS